MLLQRFDAWPPDSCRASCRGKWLASADALYWVMSSIRAWLAALRCALREYPDDHGSGRARPDAAASAGRSDSPGDRRCGSSRSLPEHCRRRTILGAATGAQAANTVLALRGMWDCGSLRLGHSPSSRSEPMVFPGFIWDAEPAATQVAALGRSGRFPSGVLQRCSYSSRSCRGGRSIRWSSPCFSPFSGLAGAAALAPRNQQRGSWISGNSAVRGLRRVRRGHLSAAGQYRQLAGRRHLHRCVPGDRLRRRIARESDDAEGNARIAGRACARALGAARVCAR